MAKNRFFIEPWALNLGIPAKRFSPSWRYCWKFGTIFGTNDLWSSEPSDPGDEVNPNDPAEVSDPIDQAKTSLSSDPVESSDPDDPAYKLTQMTHLNKVTQVIQPNQVTQLTPLTKWHK